MAEDTIGVAIVGAGRTGTRLLKEFLKYSYITMIGVVDINPNAEGIKLAKERGIYTTTDAIEMLKSAGHIDVLIEVSGDGTIKKKMKDFFGKTGNKHTIIMHDLIARLFISVCTHENHLIASLHPHDKGIGA